MVAVHCEAKLFAALARRLVHMDAVGVGAVRQKCVPPQVGLLAPDRLVHRHVVHEGLPSFNAFAHQPIPELRPRAIGWRAVGAYRFCRNLSFILSQLPGSVNRLRLQVEMAPLDHGSLAPDPPCPRVQHLGADTHRERSDADRVGEGDVDDEADGGKRRAECRNHWHGMGGRWEDAVWERSDRGCCRIR
jgi:hypothetical protein